MGLGGRIVSRVKSQRGAEKLIFLSEMPSERLGEWLAGLAGTSTTSAPSADGKIMFSAQGLWRRKEVSFMIKIKFMEHGSPLRVMHLIQYLSSPPSLELPFPMKGELLPSRVCAKPKGL
jgi:hypothetical protein